MAQTSLVNKQNESLILSTDVVTQYAQVVCNPDGSNVGASVTVLADTELPTAAALADNTANPTTSLIGSCLMAFDGTTWDRVTNGSGTAATALRVVLATDTTVPNVTGNVAHDAVDSGNPVKVGGRAVNPIILPSAITSGDRSDICTSLQGETLVYNTRLDSGEDQTNNVQAVIDKPVAVPTYTPDQDTSAAAEASSVTKANPGNLYKVVATNSSGVGRYWQMFNSTTVPADTTVPVISIYVAAGGSIDPEWKMGKNFSVGMAWCWSSTAATKTVGSTDGIATVDYK